MEDIPEDQQVLAGTFSLNEQPIVILFDSGATHIFISKACTEKRQLVIERMHTPYMISTSGGKIFTRQVVVNTSLNLKGRVYKMCLIILDGQGIDVILEMNWMKRHRALLLESCIWTIWSMVVLLSNWHCPPVTTTSVQHIATQNLEDILMVHEFLDVFLDDLPGLPQDQDV
jgi:hypothetical protein